jgi:hypothetical protein
VATFVGSDGLIQSASENTQRIDYSSGIPALLVEESKTNLLLNSLLDGTNLATQSVIVTAAAHTLSFYGTGTVDLTGTHTATVVGTGAYPTRTTLTFTSTAGSLTLTVTGDVKFANLTLGAFATSFIPTAGSAVTRNADLATMTGTNFSDWFNASEGTFVANAVFGTTTPSNFSTILEVDDGTANNRMYIRYPSSPGIEAAIISGGSAQAALTRTFAQNTKAALGYKLNNFGLSVNASAVAKDTVGSVLAADFWLVSLSERRESFAGVSNERVF